MEPRSPLCPAEPASALSHSASVSVGASTIKALAHLECPELLDDQLLQLAEFLLPQRCGRVDHLPDILTAVSPDETESTMAKSPTIRLPRQWPRHVKSGILHAIGLASAAIVAAHGRAAGRRRLVAELEQARQEIALLREELDIKDGRWSRSRTRRRPHYSPTQRLRILQLRAARGWTLEKTARVFLLGRLRRCRRIEPRTRWRRAPVGCSRGIGLALDVNYVDGRKHLPVIELRRAA